MKIKITALISDGGGIQARTENGEALFFIGWSKTAIIKKLRADGYKIPKAIEKGTLPTLEEYNKGLIASVLFNGGLKNE